MLAAIYGDEATLLGLNGDVEAMELDSGEVAAIAVVEKELPANGGEAESSDDDDDDDEDEDDEDDKTPVTGAGSKYNSDDEDDKEAYLEEIREWNYKRGIAGTPPRSVREKMKADAEQERKDAEEQAKKAAAEAAAEKQSNGAANAIPTPIKQEPIEEPEQPAPEHNAPQKPLNVEEYQRGHTPEYLRAGSPFLMTLEEEEEYYDEIETHYDGGIPPVERAHSPSAAKAEGDPRNPMSVYRWLRKNQPKVFLQNEEAEGGKKPRGRGGRRKVIEAESGDEGGAVKPAEPSTKKRRKANGNEMAGEPSAAKIAPGGRGRGGPREGGRKNVVKTEGEPPSKKQRR
jgi:hypothetical protein